MNNIVLFVMNRLYKLFCFILMLIGHSSHINSQISDLLRLICSGVLDGGREDLPHIPDSLLECNLPRQSLNGFPNNSQDVVETMSYSVILLYSPSDKHVKT